MKWNKFRLKTRTEAENVISSILADLGIEGVEIEDNVPLSEQEKEQMFVDILPPAKTDDGVAYLSFYLEEEEDKEKMLGRVREALAEMQEFMDLGECSIEESQTEDIDWVNNWKQYFHQFYVDDILIVPSWEQLPEESQGKMIIRIDPGTAFGTGMHETTQLCIRMLRKYVHPGDEILDVGTGSGILGMLAVKFGAKHFLGTDLDPCAEEAVRENMERNGITAGQYDMVLGNIIDDAAIQEKAGFEKYDVVMANILAEVLVPLTPVVVKNMKPGAVYITSGIIDDKENVVAEAVQAAGLEILEIEHQGEWVGIAARKH
jgi:ribosomal protein L11 methyltransferase